eukprot:TRINITY_DN1013_c0_g1_i4.p1 TRINITY_DN1013_c0_g1~~TRINITY_DN1013_c0_g1_i4.p1  ORF type:complete len:662 (-),score=30.44 TRINITY_DN1013_c0_g1_i4:48-1952(-)
MEPLYVGQDMVQVISRIRPLSTREKILLEEQTEIPSNRYIPFNISDNTIEVLTEEGKAKLFNFDYAYGPEATQETIFERSIGPMLEQSLEKSNGLAIFVYGATGSGRRFTLGGVPECPGILPRIFRALFDFKKGFLGAKMSCIEIYNEYVKDLTVDFKAGHDLKIKESKEKGVYIEGLNETPVNSAEECISLLAISNKNHAIAATCMGMSTTRSNVIYTIEGVTGEGIAKKIHMVRLAGTERIPKTSATHFCFNGGLYMFIKSDVQTLIYNKMLQINLTTQSVMLSVIGGTMVSLVIFNQYYFFTIIEYSLLYSLATTLNLALYNRFTGMSSIFESLAIHLNKSKQWEFAFFYGLVAATYGLYLCASFLNIELGLFEKPQINTIGFTLGGFLIGFGTKLAGGCPIFFGVCGVPSLSLRAFISCAVFTMTGVFTATLNSYFQYSNIISDARLDKLHEATIKAGFSILTICFIYKLIANQIGTIGSFFVGVIIGLGFAISGLCKQSTIIKSLCLVNWNPSLFISMGSAMVLNLVLFKEILKGKYKHFDRKNDKIPWKLAIAGSISFGIGWGLAGLCPGPGMVNVFFSYKMVPYIFFMALGNLVAGYMISSIKAKNGQLQRAFFAYVGFHSMIGSYY